MTDRDTRLKRLRIRSWRRGTKEMDLILGRFFDDRGADLDERMLDAYEALLSENDQDLYRWFTQGAREPAEHSDVLAAVRGYHAEHPAKV